MKLAIAALMSILLVGCNVGGSDGYKFETKDYTAKQVILTTKTYEDRIGLLTAYSQVGKPIAEGRSLQAFSTVNKYSDGTVKCEIHIMEPTVKYQPDFIGHEVTHCLYGQFHPSQH